MYKEITQSMFIDEFMHMGRQDQFSYDGLCALYDYFEDMEESTGEKQELDVIAICCEWTEYENFKAFKAEYNGMESIEELENNTIVIPIDDESFIIQDF